MSHLELPKNIDKEKEARIKNEFASDIAIKNKKKEKCKKVVPQAHA